MKGEIELDMKVLGDIAMSPSFDDRARKYVVSVLENSNASEMDKNTASKLIEILKAGVLRAATTPNKPGQENAKVFIDGKRIY